MNINYTPEQGKACLEIENAELRKENQRLNNVLNELEKWLKNFKELYEGNEFQNNAKFCITVDNVLDKLKELKESDK